MKVETYRYSQETFSTYEMIRAWSPATFPIPELLPRLGVIVRDDEGDAICYLCADMSNSIPRAFIDYLQTKPGISSVKKWKAVKMAESFLCERLSAHGYIEILGISPHSSVAFIAQSIGYKVHPSAVVAFKKNIQ